MMAAVVSTPVNHDRTLSATSPQFEHPQLRDSLVVVVVVVVVFKYFFVQVMPGMQQVQLLLFFFMSTHQQSHHCSLSVTSLSLSSRQLP